MDFRTAGRYRRKHLGAIKYFSVCTRNLTVITVRRRVVWMKGNPHNISATNDRINVKVMIFVALINGMTPIIHAFIKEEGDVISVNGASYLKLLQEVKVA